MARNSYTGVGVRYEVNLSYKGTRAVNTLVIHYLRNHAFEAVRLPGYSIYK